MGNCEEPVLIKKTTQKLTVRRAPGAFKHRGLISFQGGNYSCSLGKSGIVANKHEGDGATPSGKFQLLYGYYRADRLGIVKSALPMQAIDDKMAWCDEANHSRYNQPVQLPFKPSHERLKREDRLYDVCLVMDYNITRCIKNRGSAVFFHQTEIEQGPTQGCIAIDPVLMRRLLAFISRNSVIEILA